MTTTNRQQQGLLDGVSVDIFSFISSFTCALTPNMMGLLGGSSPDLSRVKKKNISYQALENNSILATSPRKCINNGNHETLDLKCRKKLCCFHSELETSPVKFVDSIWGNFDLLIHIFGREGFTNHLTAPNGSSNFTVFRGLFGKGKHTKVGGPKVGDPHHWKLQGSGTSLP